MKYALMYAVMMYLIYCSDNIDDGSHTKKQRVLRCIFWPLTLHSLFVAQNQRLHRLLTSLWVVLVAGWVLSLMADRL